MLLILKQNLFTGNIIANLLRRPKVVSDLRHIKGNDSTIRVYEGICEEISVPWLS